MNVWCVIVTRNRRQQLGRCLEAVMAQVQSPNRILVVDNDSDDGTDHLLATVGARDDRLAVRRTGTNIGGAGGFHLGMRIAYEAGAEAVWLMDDDALPAVDCLEQLLSALRSYPAEWRPAMAASRVDWRDNKPHTMNVPCLRFRSRDEQDAQYRCVEHGHMLLRQNTFVSVLFRREALTACGLPIAAYFLWVDDIEYTLRVCHRFVGIMVPASRVVHDTRALHDCLDATPSRFYLVVRNGLWTWRVTRALVPWERFVYLASHLVAIGQWLVRRRCTPRSCVWLARGVWHALRRAPQVVDHLDDVRGGEEEPSSEGGAGR